MAWLAGVGALLLDVDGTLLHGDDAVPGAPETVARLRERGIAFRLTTNTTRRPRSAVARALVRAGIPVTEDEVVAPSILARRRILASGRRRAALLVPPDCAADFAGVEPVEQRPDWVVLGDLGPGFTWDVLNEAFGWLRQGATLLALQKNRFWHAGERGLVLDAGAFVAALEFAAGVEAQLVGKPAPAFFELALEILGRPASEVLVVGDDPQSDGRGGADAGCRTAVVRTGKYSDDLLAAAGLRPDLVLASVAELSPA